MRLLRALAWLRRRSRVGAYAAVLSLPAAMCLAAAWWRLNGRKDRLRLHHCSADDAAKAVVERMSDVMDYRPTPWLLVRRRLHSARREPWLSGAWRRS